MAVNTAIHARWGFIGKSLKLAQERLGHIPHIVPLPMHAGVPIAAHAHLHPVFTPPHCVGLGAERPAERFRLRAVEPIRVVDLTCSIAESNLRAEAQKD